MIKRILSIFWNAPGGRPLSVGFCMWFSSMAELTSMGALVPLASQLSSDGGKTDSYLGKGALAFLSNVGIEPTFTHLLIVVGIALIIKSLLAFLSMRYVAMSVADVGMKIRSKLLHAFMNARWAYYVDHPPGQVAAMISVQSAMAGDAFYGVALLITTTISAIGLLITAFLVSGRLVIFCLVATSALAFPLFFILRRAQATSLQQWATSNDLTSGVQDVLNNMKPLKAMARQARFIDNFTDSIKMLRGAQILMVVSRHAIYHGQDILGALMIIAGVYVGIEVLKTPLAEMLVVGIIFYQMVDIIKRIQLHLQDATMQSAAYYSVLDTIKLAEKQLEATDGKNTPVLNKGIAFEHVSFSYGTKHVLKDVSFCLPTNQVSVLIGPSGAGKTTIVDLLIGFYRPALGRIMVDGADLKDINVASWRKMIGYVPQELTLLRGSIYDNITLGDTSISKEDVTEALRLAGAQGFVDGMMGGITADIGTMGAKLSGGQRQRISLARALVHKPRLLLLDEVTSALDDVTEAEICENILELSGQLTIVAITHKPAWTKIASKIYRVNEGTVEERQTELAA